MSGPQQVKDGILDVMLRTIRAGISILPIDCKTKRPAGWLLPKGEDGVATWKPFQNAIANEATVRQWAASGIKSFAVVCGAVSGGLMVLDFDVPRFYKDWLASVGEVVDGLPIQQTGGGGLQVLVRCPNPGGNLKLAWMPNDAEENGREIAIETRGEGGYGVVAPSLHPSGNFYKWVVGDTASVPTVPQEQVDFLLAAARALDEAPMTKQDWEHQEAQARAAHPQRQARPNGQASVIDGYNRAHSVEEKLDRHGYVKGSHGRYIRPGGKSESVSVKDGKSCHFSSNDALNDGRGKSGCGVCDAFDIFTRLEHRGDVSAAVKAAADELGMTEPRKASGKTAVVSTVNVSTPAPAPEPYEAFPLDALPPKVSRFVDESAKAMGCDAAFIALPVMAQLASAIGNSRRIRLKKSWTEPPVLWMVPVGDSGSLKSPAHDAALRPIRERQRKTMKEYKLARAEYEDAKAEYDEALKVWRRTKPEERGERPEEPEVPVCERLWVSDITVEALADRLSNAPRGLLVAPDELSGWLASFNQYKSGQGGDVAHWLEMHRAGPLLVDRKHGDKTTIHVPRASVCIAGGIQPDTLRRCLTPEYYANGLAARLLLAMPPKRIKRWTEADVSDATLQSISDVFNGLLELQPSTTLDGEQEPADVTLIPVAKSLWVDFYNAHAIEQAELGGDLAAAWSKLEGYAARFALVHHCIRQVSGERVDPWQCDELSMVSGTVLADWFGREAKRVYGLLCESEEDKTHRRLLELVQAKGGQATVRELARSSRLYANADEWEQALTELVQAGVGRWQNPKPGTTGGHPVKVFHVLTEPEAGTAVDMSTVDTTPCGDSASGGNVNCQHVNSEPEYASTVSDGNGEVELLETPDGWVEGDAR